jgi:hypothetical protein
MGIILQSVLSKNYPKVRKGLFVFPVNWFVQLFWDTLLRPLLSTLQPDIEDKVSPAARVACGGARAARAGSRGYWFFFGCVCGLSDCTFALHFCRSVR